MTHDELMDWACKVWVRDSKRNKKIDFTNTRIMFAQDNYNRNKISIQFNDIVLDEVNKLLICDRWLAVKYLDESCYTNQ